MVESFTEAASVWLKGGVVRLLSPGVCLVLDPGDDCDCIDDTPAMVLNCDSSGVATALAMVVGSAPGRLAETLIVGKSTAGSSLTGSGEKPNKPKATSAAISNTVITGRSMNGPEIFIALYRSAWASPCLW